MSYTKGWFKSYRSKKIIHSSFDPVGATIVNPWSNAAHIGRLPFATNLIRWTPFHPIYTKFIRKLLCRITFTDSWPRKLGIPQSEQSEVNISISLMKFCWASMEPTPTNSSANSKKTEAMIRQSFSLDMVACCHAGHAEKWNMDLINECYLLQIKSSCKA